MDSESCFARSTMQYVPKTDVLLQVRFTKIYLLSRCADPSAPFPPPELRLDVHIGIPPEPAYSAPYLFPLPSTALPSPTPSASVTSTPFASSSSNPHSRTTTSTTTQSSSTQPTTASSDDIDGSKSGSESSASSADAIFAHDPTESDADEDFYDLDDDGMFNRKMRPSLHPKRLPRRTKSGTLSLSSGSQMTSSQAFTSTSQTQLYSSKLALSDPKLGGGSQMDDTFRQLDQYVTRRGAALGADSFVLCSFSTGQTLEEHVTLSAHRIRPGELLEVSKSQNQRSFHTTH